MQKGTIVQICANDGRSARIGPDPVAPAIRRKCR
jgi:hypothetical protein